MGPGDQLYILCGVKMQNESELALELSFLTSDLIVFLESLPRLTKEHFSHEVFLRVSFHSQVEKSRADAVMQLLQERQKRHKAQREVDTLKSQSQCKIHEVSVIIIHST